MPGRATWSARTTAAHKPRQGKGHLPKRMMPRPQRHRGVFHPRLLSHEGRQRPWPQRRSKRRRSSSRRSRRKRPLLTVPRRPVQPRPCSPATLKPRSRLPRQKVSTTPRGRTPPSRRRGQALRGAHGRRDPVDPAHGTQNHGSQVEGLAKTHAGGGGACHSPDRKRPCRHSTGAALPSVDEPMTPPDVEMGSSPAPGPRTPPRMANSAPSQGSTAEVGASSDP